MIMPTEIQYRERVDPPYASERKVEVYGEDREERLRQLPREVQAFENALSSVVEQIRRGDFVRR
jgi:hypothetical protein